MPDDTLQRTLLLAQQFVDQTKADAEAQAAKVLAEAESRARGLTEQRQPRPARSPSSPSGRLRDEISRLEEIRGQLSQRRGDHGPPPGVRAEPAPDGA